MKSFSPCSFWRCVLGGLFGGNIEFLPTNTQKSRDFGKLFQGATKSQKEDDPTFATSLIIVLVGSPATRNLLSIVHTLKMLNADFAGPLARLDMDEETYYRFWNYLTTGPAAFGEHHAFPYARNAAINFIQAGAVKKLFIERAEYPILGKMPGERLREHAAKVRAGEADFNTEIDGKGLAPANMGAGDNETSWEMVVRWAVASGVDVYYFDESFVGDAGSHDNMVARNRVMAQRFNENTDEIAQGALIINGSSHLNNEAETGELHRACNIDQERVFIFPEK